MTTWNRRQVLLGAGAAVATPAAALADRSPGFDVPWKRIATEEAFLTTEVAARYDRLIAGGLPGEPGFSAMWRGIGSSEVFRSRLTNLGDGRLEDMDTAGIAMQVLSLTAPGVQVFDAGEARSLARSANDELADAIGRHPDRFAGLAAVAPQDPPGAAKELERAIDVLGLNGAVINSHTRGEYLDQPEYWPIFEAAEALSAPIYIHPRTPPKPVIGPYMARGLTGPLAGFAHEVYLHVLAIITAGVFDRFPGLQLVVGHLGEGLPNMMYRLDYMQHHAAAPGLRDRPEGTTLELKISDYLKRNVSVTTSGMAWAPAIQFAQQVMGVDRVLYAMDYPYQFDVGEVLATDDLPISESEKAALYQGNAERLFRLNINR